MLFRSRDLHSIIPILPHTALVIFTTYSTASLEQLFLCWLYFSLCVFLPYSTSRHHLSSSRTKSGAIATFLVVTIAFHVSPSFLPDINLRRGDSQLAASFAAAILLLTTHSPYGPSFLASKYARSRFLLAETDLFSLSRIGAISCAATDVMIASALMYTFIRMEMTSAFRVSTHRWCLFFRIQSP